MRKHIAKEIAFMIQNGRNLLHFLMHPQTVMMTGETNTVTMKMV